MYESSQKYMYFVFNYIVCAVEISEMLYYCSHVAQNLKNNTTYRHLQNMVAQGYIACGFADGMASTYYITEDGQTFYKLQE